MTKLLALILALATSALFGCATPPVSVVPDSYKGPTATIRDSVWSDVVNRGDFFFVSEIDGKPIRTSLDAERSFTSGKGMVVAGVTIERSVPTRPLRLRLQGRRVWGAPIQELFHAAEIESTSIDAVIEFEPSAGALYIVRGKLDPKGSEIWLQDTAGVHVGKLLPK